MPSGMYCQEWQCRRKSSKCHQQCTAKNGDAGEKAVNAVRNVLPRIAMQVKKQ